MRILRNLLVASTMLVANAAVAQDTQSVDALLRRDTLLPPVLAWLQQQGNKLTLIGEEAGLKGYLLESPTGKLQSVYVAPDGKHVILGLLYEQGGKNVTGVQLGEMRKRFDNAAKALGTKTENASAIDAANALKQGHLDAAGAGSTDKPEADGDKPTQPAPAVTEPAPTAETAPIEAVPPLAEPATPEVKPDASSPALPVTPPAAPVALPEAASAVVGADGNPSDVWASKIDRDQFIKAAEATPFFEVGSRLAPVTLWMVADPKCPYCHAAWDHLEPLVFDKKLKVRVIMINALEGSEPFAREILASPAPGRRWIESKAGTNLEPKVDPNSKEWKDTEKYLAMNMDFAKSFGVDRTPFLGYVAPDGRFYTVLGLPSDLDSFLYASGVKSK
ncbi:thioredoxin fold domain-containing protein [Rhizobium laguerreae]|uniref:thioredoxin fold domain-containing protein n=1 Tax=Rhizobium laguerreae TaxID=1076926 RepID=UPI001C92663E|nr:thioredoxin fold domain-containing protein [Rhizobium laguerreae]MBY3151254.1 thioredoxin fold domain-containing protein [Rhizobium laguerreae]